jgi:probable F420-dependent oxidoreductase
MPKLRVGVQLHPQHVSYPSFAEAVKTVEAIGVDTIWHWDHFYPLYGEADGPHFEAYTLLTAMAMLTTRAEVGCLVTCNNYRNPNLLADMLRTLDHISGGRAILGIGAGWFERDYTEYGYEFGNWTYRFDEFEKNLPIIRSRWAKLNPPPLRPIPVLIGGGGEKKTLRLTAQYADMWNGFGSPDEFRHKNQVLDRWCAEVGRNPAEIERTASLNLEQLDQLDAYVDAGMTHMILGMGAPWDFAPVERMVAWRDQARR